MGRSIISTSNAPAAVGTYSQGVELDGTYYFSGQIGLEPSSMEMADGFQGQLDQVMKNIDGLLQACSLTRQNIVKTSIFLTDLGQFSLVNTAYENFFEQPYPARSCVEVPALPKGALVEIEVIAAE
ncbi:MAG: RidA family protein [Halobacteriovoraceae bacterium]|jgi:2-iminobutanoate/2-iminopropanoate deaminase|nr:RidA family protein [Halobacteriovoraceae bacterium]MBT5093749.1 RidA family protein [Halobacteriovoraceae bacterium]